MSKDVSNYVIGVLQQDKSRVDKELLLTAMFLVEKWKKNMISGPDEKLTELLEKEEFDPEAMEYLRQLLVEFASTTDSLELLQSTITTLNVFQDKRHIPLYQTWLFNHAKKLTMHNAIMSSILFGLEKIGEDVIKLNRKSWSAADMEVNLGYARSYLKDKLGLSVPY